MKWTHCFIVSLAYLCALSMQGELQNENETDNPETLECNEDATSLIYDYLT